MPNSHYLHNHGDNGSRGKWATHNFAINNRVLKTKHNVTLIKDNQNHFLPITALCHQTTETFYTEHLFLSPKALFLSTTPFDELSL